ncbi:MAG: putative Ig domain-containing protein [Ignavibacteriae bacterium]|nr:putative Ig domain-containing protein [Ignavibacteria bacterium]MBI3363338.1 putative Ig domain-containing protein [Ignavibacteriota bacterium]
MTICTYAQNSSEEIIGTPWIGGRGVALSTSEIMARARELNARGVQQPVRKHPEHEVDRKHLPLNPFSPNVSQWPPRPIEQKSTQESGVLAPQTLSTNFTGVTLADAGAFPPDGMGAIGPTQFIVDVNGRIRSFDKSTGIADGVLDVNTDVFFSSVMTPPLATNFTSDPRIRYDRLSGQWMAIMIDVPGGSGTQPNRILLAVSNTSTITLSTVWTYFYFRQDSVLPLGNANQFADYPTLGIDNNALYIGCNMFNSSGAFTGTTGFVVRKSSILGAGPIVVTAFRGLVSSASAAGPYTPQGVDNFDPSATEGYFIGVDNATFGTLMLRRVSNPGTTPSISSNISLTVLTTTFPVTVPHLGNTQGTSGELDALDDRLFAAVIRNGHLWTAHNIRVSNTGSVSGTTSRDAARWYDITNLGTTPSLTQSGTVYAATAANDTLQRNYWIPSVMVSGQGHVALGFSTAGVSEHANAGTVGRLSGDATGTMQTPLLYTASSTAYNPSSDPGGTSGRRWGDYSYTSLDPSDDMTMWTIQEFCDATNSWGCRVAKLLAPLPATPSATAPSSITTGTTVNVTVTGTSASGSGFFDPGTGFTNRLAASVNGGGVTVNSVTYTNPTSLTLNITVASNATAGGRTITATNPDGQSATSTSAILTINSGSCPTITLSPTTVPNGTVGTSYNQTITASGGTSPYTFAVTSGSLPAGLSLSSGGVISGTPTTAGNSNFTITATDGSGNNCTGSQSYSLTINAAVVTDIALTSLGSTYAQDFNTLASSGSSNTWTDNSTIPGWFASTTTYAASTGSSTTGALYSFGSSGSTERALGSLVTNGTGEISYGARFVNQTGSTITSLAISYTGEQWRNNGNTTAQTLAFQYQVANAGVLTSITSGTWTNFSSLDFTSPIHTSSASSLDGNSAANRTALSATLSVTAANGQEVWVRWRDVNDAGNDHGLAVDDFSLTPNGVSPTNPAVVGAANPSTVTAGNTTLLTGTVTPGTNPSSTGLAVTGDLSSIGGSATQQFYDDATHGDVTSGDNMFSFSATVALATTAGAKTLPLTVTDVQSRNGSGSISLTVTSPSCPTITLSPSTLPNGTVGTAYNQTITASGGTSPYTFAVTVGTLPAGLSLSTGGILSGTPTTSGTSNFTVTATDANTCTGLQAYSLIIDAAPPSGSISLTALGSPYTQDFNTLANTGTSSTVPTGWAFSEAGANANGVYSAGTGSSTSGDTWSFGPTSSSERAFGGLQSGSLNPTIGANFTNNTGSTIVSLAISYAGEEWRLGTRSRFDSLRFQLSINATSLTTGTWTAYGVLDLRTPDTSGAAGSRDGNTIRSTISSTISGFSISNGSTFWIRWTDVDATGSDDGLAVDDFSLTPNGASPTNPSGTGAANPSTVAAGNSALLTVTVAPGTNPASTGLTVTGDLSSIGGSATQQFFDDGSHGDVTTGDNVFSFQATVTVGTTAGAKTLSISIGDAQSRSGSTTISLTVQTTCPTITLTAPPLASGTVGVAYNQLIQASGGTAPYSFAKTSGTLPAGLTLNANGSLTGTPTAAGAPSSTITATDSLGCTGNNSYTITISCPTIALSPSSLPDGSVGSSYNQTLSASGGRSPYSFAVTSGLLPGGMTLSSSGTLSGIASASGNFSFTVTATDSFGCMGSQTYTIIMSCPSITVSPSSLPGATNGTPYSQLVTATGGTTPYTFSVTSGSLPTGISLSSAGSLSGTPTVTGSFDFTIRAIDSSGCTGTRQYSIIVSSPGCPTITLSPSILPDGTSGTAYNHLITASGGAAPYSFGVLSGSLPPGISLSTSGNLSGIPTASGDYSFTISATDNLGCVGTRGYNLAVAQGCPIIVVAPTTIPNGIVGVAYAETLSASGGIAPYVYSLGSGSIPGGLTLSSTGILSGTPNGVDSTSFTVAVIDMNGCPGTKQYSIKILPNPLTSISVSVKDRWNLVSNPLKTNNDSVAFLFAGATSQAFANIPGSGYLPSLTLSQGVGYWLRFDVNRKVNLTGVAVAAESVDVADGWNLIGSVSSKIPASALAGIGTNVLSRIFGFDGSYIAVDSIEPGKGVWVKCDAPGKLVFSSATGMIPSTLSRTAAYDMKEFDKLVFTDADGDRQTLYLGANSGSEVALDQFALPPFPPANGFDVRFEGNRMLELYHPNSFSQQMFKIMIQSQRYPITVRWERGAGPTQRISLRSVKGDLLATSSDLNRSGTFRLLDDRVTSLVVKVQDANRIPEQVVLFENYPNPFNPSTRIRFDLPTESFVSLKIFNTLGQEVTTIIDNRLMEEGLQEAEFDAGSLSAGVYVYRLTVIPRTQESVSAIPVITSKKMILLK